MLNTIYNLVRRAYKSSPSGFLIGAAIGLGLVGIFVYAFTVTPDTSSPTYASECRAAASHRGYESGRYATIPGGLYGTNRVCYGVNVDGSEKELSDWEGGD